MDSDRSVLIMNYSLIIPAFDDGHLLRTRIAGLTLLERLGHVARKSGIPRVIVLGPQPESRPAEKQSVEFISRFQDWPKVSPTPCIVLKCGYLPEATFFKSLTQSIRGSSSSFLLHFPALVLMDGGQESRLQRLWEKGGFERVYDELEQLSSSEVLALDGEKVYDVREPEKITAVENRLFRELIKDTEGFMSQHLERKISIAITKQLVNTSVTPNQMTVLSILIGLAGAFFMGINRGFWQVLGSGLFLFHSILDGCDGEIARIKFTESRRGGLLDFWGDNIVHSAVFLAIAWEWWSQAQILFPFFLAALAVSATWGSAGLIYWKTMRSKSGEGPLYTSVSSSGEKNRITTVMDFLSRRDFIYLVVILSFLGHLDWFLYASAIGTPVFAGVLLWLMIGEKLKTHGERQGEGSPGGKGK